MSHYDATGHCLPCNRHYGQHNDGCPLQGKPPKCMTPASDDN